MTARRAPILVRILPARRRRRLDVLPALVLAAAAVVAALTAWSFIR